MRGIGEARMIDFDALRRWPDVEAPELRAWDAADSLILDEAAALLPGSDPTIIGDEYGALTLGALDRGAASARVHTDSLAGELALAANGDGAYTSLPLSLELVDGAHLVLLRLPRSLEALEQIAALIATHAAPDVVVVAGGRLKHMTVSMNEVLLRHFGQLDISHARQKSRVLIAREPRASSGDRAATEVPRRPRAVGCRDRRRVRRHVGRYRHSRAAVGARPGAAVRDRGRPRLRHGHPRRGPGPSCAGRERARVGPVGRGGGVRAADDGGQRTPGASDSR